MRGHDHEFREALQCALEDEVGERDRRLQRVADRVAQQPLAGQAATDLELARAHRVHEDQHAQLFALGPEGVVIVRTVDGERAVLVELARELRCLFEPCGVPRGCRLTIQPR